MNLFIHSHGLMVSQEAKAHLEEKLEFALSGVAPRIHRLDAYFTDHNGNKGGDDKSLRMVVHLKGQPEIVVEERDGEIHRLIDICCDRLGQTAHRQWDRVLSNHHRAEKARL